MNRRDFVFSALALSGCATVPAVSTDTLTFQELEPLYDLWVGRRGLSFGMVSGGCTSRANTVFYVERDDRVSKLAFARRRIDRCRRPDERQVELHFTWAELGFRGRKRVVLLNPVRE